MVLLVTVEYLADLSAPLQGYRLLLWYNTKYMVEGAILSSSAAAARSYSKSTKTP